MILKYILCFALGMAFWAVVTTIMMLIPAKNVKDDA